MLRTKNVVRAFLCQTDLNPPEENSCIRAWFSYPPHSVGGYLPIYSVHMCSRNNPLFHGCYKRQLIVKGPCADFGIFLWGGGGGGLRSIWYINYPFPRFQRRSNIFRGGSNFFQRRGVVSNCLFSNL